MEREASEVGGSIGYGLWALGHVHGRGLSEALDVVINQDHQQPRAVPSP